MNSRLYHSVVWISFLFLTLAFAPIAAHGQTITATLTGSVSDATGAIVPGTTVTATNTSTGVSRSTVSSDTGEYRISSLTPGTYEVTVERPGFRREIRTITVRIGQAAKLNFTLQVGELAQEVVVEAGQVLLETTRADIGTVIVQEQINLLPVNGRQFIDFALLAPGVTIGDTTSGSTDVIIEPVTKISFAGQNIHYNLVTVDGADNISTASGVQKTTPSQEAVQEFRVINTQFSVEAGRAAGGIVNIITKSGTNNWHGSIYEFFRNDKLDAKSILASPGLNKLRQNQFGGTIGGPLQKDKVFLFANYEGQRRSENPFYSQVALDNIDLINTAKTTLFGQLPAGAPGTLPAENLNVTRTFDYNQILVKVDAALSENHYLFIRHFFNDAELQNQSPLNDGSDLPSAFKDNFLTDNSLVGSLTSTFSTNWVNELRVQYARRFFDFPTVTTQPRLEVTNNFVTGMNRGNPEFYKETRFEINDSVTITRGKHIISFGGNVNFVDTEESFPLWYPFEADFGCIRASQCGTSYEAGNPFVVFFQRNDTASNFTEPSIFPNGTAVFSGGRIPDEIRNLAKGQINHTYNGFFIQDKWQATPNLTLNFGVRYEWETWERNVIDTDSDNIDPRIGLAYNFATSKNIVLRAGAGLFHGIIPNPLFMAQLACCGGAIGKFPGRENIETDSNAPVRLFAFASAGFINGAVISQLLQNGLYPDAVDSTAVLGFPCGPNNILSECGFFGDAVVVRFAQDHEAPYGIQMTLSVGFEPFKDTFFNASYLRVKGVDLGSFFNINQPPANTCSPLYHDSSGNQGLKSDFHVQLDPNDCSPASLLPFPGTAFPFFTPPPSPGPNDIVPDAITIYFEADSLWESVYDGLLIDFKKPATGRYGFGISYTWSKSLDNGPNPSFVLIPQESTRFDLERAVSSDHVAHRLVGNLTFVGPTDINAFVNDFKFGTIVSAQSAHFFTKFSGFDSNGTVFGVNDRVGIEPRNTFKGDRLFSFDARISRTFHLGETANLEFIAEVFNLFDTLNVRFFNTVYGAADFCSFNPTAPGCTDGGGNPLPLFLEGSPNAAFGTPRAINNPRQVQFALRLTF